MDIPLSYNPLTVFKEGLITRIPSTKSKNANFDPQRSSSCREEEEDKDKITAEIADT